MTDPGHNTREPVLKATPENQSLLLDLQAVDTRLDQLAHQEATLPQTAQLAELTDRLAELNTDVVNASTELSDLSQDVRKAEDEVEQVRKRTTRDQSSWTPARSPRVSSSKRYNMRSPHCCVALPNLRMRSLK